jgi:inner membrane protein
VPSPLGHALGGIAAGWAVAGVNGHAGGGSGGPRSGRRSWTPTVAFAVLGALPDLDLLVGLHSRYTHSVGAAVLVAALAALAFDRRRPIAGAIAGQASRLVFALACGAAYGSHILLDWLGSDSTAPIGIMALWPLSSAFYQSDLHWFAAISRRYWLPEFFRMNALAAGRELLILGPLVIAIGCLRARRSPPARR